MQENIQNKDINSVTPVNSVSALTNDQQPKANSFLVILLSILLLISVSIAGFFAYQTQKLVKELNMLKVEPTPIATVESTSEPVATDSALIVDPTTNWKTYDNSEFSFKYPENYITNGKNIYNVDKSIEIWAFGKADPLYNECMKLDKSESMGKLLVKSFSGVTTGEMCDPQNNIDRKEKWIVREGGDGFAPGMQFSYKGTNVEAVKIFDQILSTFKFTN